MSALIKTACPHCNGHLELDAADDGRETRCPHCGAGIQLLVPRPPSVPPLPVYAQQPRLPSPLLLPKPRRSNPLLTTLAALVVIPVFLVVLIFVVALIKTAANFGSPESEARHAWYAARDYVPHVLKALSTAKFASLLDSRCGAESLGPETWRVWGYVDSQNSFGALIRSDWSAKVQKVPEGWKVSEIRLSP